MVALHSKFLFPSHYASGRIFLLTQARPWQLLAAVGEMFETPYGASAEQTSSTRGDQVTGVIMSSRKAFFRINIWTRDSDEREKVQHIGQHLKYDVLGFNGPAGSREGKGLQSDVEFVSHEASQKTKNPKGWSV